MKILFLKQSKGIWDPLGMEYVSAVVRRAGHQTRLFYGSDQNLMGRIQEYGPQILAYSVTTGFHNYYLRLNRMILRELPALKPVSVYGGPHATFFPEMIETEGVDAVCRGEGESAFLDFVERLEAGKDHTTTPNFWVKTRKGITRNDVRPLIEDLDSLPLPDRDLFFADDAYLRELGPKTFFTNRGCPYNCTYCFNHAMRKIYRGKGTYLRTHSVDYVMRDVENVRANYSLRYARFFSDVFNLFPDWFEEFCTQYAERVKVPFMVNLRANMVDANVARRLAEAGCCWVFLGMESGDDHIRNDVLKRNMDSETIRKAVRTLQDNGVDVATQSMIGLPGETFEQAMRTLKLTAECAPAYAWTSVFNPYPRTELGDYAVKRGYFTGDYDRIDYTFYSGSILEFRSAREKLQIENLHKLLAFSAYFKFLIPLMPVLTTLPLQWFYKTIYRLWWGFRQGTRLTPFYLTPKALLWSVHRFLRTTLGKE